MLSPNKPPLLSGTSLLTVVPLPININLYLRQKRRRGISVYLYDVQIKQRRRAIHVHVQSSISNNYVCVCTSMLEKKVKQRIIIILIHHPSLHPPILFHLSLCSMNILDHHHPLESQYFHSRCLLSKSLSFLPLLLSHYSYDVHS